MSDDLGAISQVLREHPPPQTASVGSHPFVFRWATAAVALTLVLVMIWQGVRLWSPSNPGQPNGTGNQEIWSLLQDFTTDNFLLSEANAGELWVELGAASGLAEAPDEGWPPDWYDFSPRGDAELWME